MSVEASRQRSLVLDREQHVANSSKVGAGVGGGIDADLEALVGGEAAQRVERHRWLSRRVRIRVPIRMRDPAGNRHAGIHRTRQRPHRTRDVERITADEGQANVGHGAVQFAR